MRKVLSEYSTDPIYNMKAVEQQTNISAATLRAWERRYALVEPRRTTGGYRLYSDRDVALLRWVRAQMADGMTISRVVAMLASLRDSGEPIWVDGDNGQALVKDDTPLPPANLVQPLFEALATLDDNRADEIIDQAFAMYSMSTVYVELIAPTLKQMGEAWHRGDVLVSTEHFATTYLRGRLLALLQACPRHPDMPVIFVGCAPNERHDVGALIFAVMLRQQGLNVVYLGQDVPVEDVVFLASQEHSLMICLSANSRTTALGLRDVQSRLQQLEPPYPLFGYGGRAFDGDSELRRLVEGHYLGGDPRDALNTLSNLIRGQHRA
jgi:methanogenic corrinoid protein MtbC1